MNLARDFSVFFITLDLLPNLLVYVFAGSSFSICRLKQGSRSLRGSGLKAAKLEASFFKT